MDLNCSASERNAHLLEQRLQVHLDRAVDDDAERALVVVLADEGERLGEMRIRHGGHGDQKVMREIHLLHSSRVPAIVKSMDLVNKCGRLRRPRCRAPRCLRTRAQLELAACASTAEFAGSSRRQSRPA